MTVDRDEGAGYWQVLEPYWDRIDIYNGPEQFLATYGEVPLVVQTLFAAHWCESEVSNGGLHQLFMNPTGVLAPEAVQAFRKLGLQDAAEVVKRAMGFFGVPYPRQQQDRVDRLETLSGATRVEWDPFLRLDDDLYASFGEGHQRLYDALDLLAASHPARADSSPTEPKQ